MFKKLLANLPFNPGLLEQVGFYAKRLRQEAAVRRLGFLMVGLALVVQVMAAMYPAQNSLAASPNDILDGITNKASILRAWDANAGHIQQIYGRFGITRNNIYRIPGQHPNATVVSTARDYWSLGRQPLSDFGIDGRRWGERVVQTQGPTVYERPLHAWDTHGFSSYPAFRGHNQYGQEFWILKTCGNPVFIGPYLPNPPRPVLTVHKTLLTPHTVHPGDTVRYRLEYQNRRVDSLATHFRLGDPIARKFDFVSLEDLSGREGNTVFIRHSGHLGYTPNPYTSQLVVRVKANAAPGSVICNAAYVDSAETHAVYSENPCVTVVGGPPPAGGYCVASTSFVNGSNRVFTIHTQTYVQGTTRITGYNYDIDSNGSLEYRDVTSENPHDKTISTLGPGNHSISVYSQLRDAQNHALQTPACVTQVNILADARVNLTKTVTNLSTGSGSASGTTVRSGDILQFKMTTTNVTDSDYLNYQGTDYFGSVLQYANIVDPNELTAQGITLDAENNLHWSLANLPAHGSDVKTIKAQVKQIVPSTNSPSTVSPDYNCTISNSYGNEVTMNVDCPVIKAITQQATNLPNTGPGATIAIGSIVAVLAGYLFARARLMSRELEIVRNEYVKGEA